MRSLRVVTWNIWGGLTREGDRVELGRVLATLRGLDADLIALQEVDRRQSRSGDLHQARWLGEALGLHWAYAPALLGRLGTADCRAAPGGPPETDRCEGVGAGESGYGIAILSRVPLTRAATLCLPRPLVHGPEERVALMAALPDPSGGGPELTVAATHLAVEPGLNLRQLRWLQRQLGDWPAPKLLLGDLNVWRRLADAGSLPGWRPLVHGGTFRNQPPGKLWPTVQIDHVLGYGVGRPRRTRIVASNASDHRAVLVEVELGQRSG